MTDLSNEIFYSETIADYFFVFKNEVLSESKQC